MLMIKKRMSWGSIDDVPTPYSHMKLQLKLDINGQNEKM